MSLGVKYLRPTSTRMEVSDLKGRLPNEIIESLGGRGIKKLTPPQELSIKAGLLESKNIVVASPTASGKTLVAEIACANSIISRGMKAVYIAPMRALVKEKYDDFKRAYPYIKTAMSIGDLDANDIWLSSYQMIFVSTEKFDSLIRHGVDWFPSIGCIVFDEVHMLDDTSRGPTLELLITKLTMISSAQMIALSATIGNAKDISKWLRAGLVHSDYRPVALKKGIVHNGHAYYQSDSYGGFDEVELSGDSELPEVRVAQDTLIQSKQGLVFYSTKRNAEAGAARLAPHVEKMLSAVEKAELQKLADKVLNVLERPTEQCKKLSGLIRNGVAFHHSGLLNAQRNYIEEAFKADALKIICSTTTLGYGVNLPAHTVLVRDISRYDDGSNAMLGINEVLQLFGRAGRPSYDKEGRALIIANSQERIQRLYESYIDAEPEPVQSKLGIVPVLRSHILAFIAEDFLNDKKAINDFMGRSFYSFQYGNSRHVRALIDEVIDDLEKWGFIEGFSSGPLKKRYKATRVGRRVSELYIDPLSAKWLMDSLPKANDTVGILYMISNTIEMRPYVKATVEAEDAFAAYMHFNKDRAIGSAYETVDYYYDPVKAFSTALMLREWMDEAQEPMIIKKYSTTPGFLYNKLLNADWIMYAAIELAKIMRVSQHELINSRVRLRYGIKEELLDLVRLEQIGRVRARMLYMNGIKSVADIRARPQSIERILGKDMAARILAQL